MGCCFSTNNPQTKPSNSSSCSQKDNTNSIAQPLTPPILEEETIVKEVHAETLISMLSPEDNTIDPIKHSSPNSKLHQNDSISKKPKFVEEASKINSTLSESLKNVPDDDIDVIHIRNQSPAKYRNREVERDKVLGMDQGRVGSCPYPGLVGSGGQSNNGLRKGSVMGPDRARSPVTRVDRGRLKTGLGQSPSGRRTRKSPDRFGPLELAENKMKFEESSPEVDPRKSRGRFGPPMLVENKMKFEEYDPEVDPANDETLENPLVSLECFIFL